MVKNPKNRIIGSWTLLALFAWGSAFSLKSACADELLPLNANRSLKKPAAKKTSPSVRRKARATPAPASYQVNEPITGSSYPVFDNQNVPETQIAAKASLAGKSVQDQYRQTRLAAFGFGMDLTHQVIARSLEAHVDAGALLQTGSSQALFYDEYAPYQGIYVTEAVVRFRPVSLFTLTAGAIDQSRFEAPILLDSRSFPGVAEAVRIPLVGKSYLEISAQQAVPTNTTLSTHSGDEILTPGMFVEQAKLGIDRGRDFQIEGGIGYFGFMNLPRSVAQESRFMGNSVTGATDSGAQFNYGYDGFLGTGKLGFPMGPSVFWNSAGSLIYNRSAPQGQNTGVFLSNAVEFTVNDKLTLAPKVDLFRNESDSSPGYYNSPDIGHNNREGYGLGLQLKLPRENFAAEAKWVNSQLLAPSALQADMQFIVISLRKSYVLL